MNENKNLIKQTYDKIVVSPELKQKLRYMEKDRSKKTWNMWTRVAAAFLFVVLLSGTGVAAAKQFHFFSKLFSDQDAATASYVSVMEKGNKGIYDGYQIAVEEFLYCEGTDYGVLQFTVKDTTKKGRTWYQEIGWADHLNDWEKRSAVEIEPKKGMLDFTMQGISGFLDYYLYGDREDENITHCQMVFGSFQKQQFSKKNLSLTMSVQKMDGTYKEALKLPVKKVRSLPCYSWQDDSGRELVRLSGVNYICMGTVGNEVSIQLTTGENYVIYSEQKKMFHQLFSLEYEENGSKGTWGAYDRILNLKNVTSFTVDGKVYDCKDAVERID